MKALILGAGKVGTSVAESLVSERNDITIIDTDGARLAELQERLDLGVVTGDAILPSVLAQAGAADADLLLACTSSDAVNLVACQIARQQFNVPLRIARIRATEFADQPEVIGPDGFGVDHLISPERAVTNYLVSLIGFPQALHVVAFAEGRVTLVHARVAAGSPLVGQCPADLYGDVAGVNAYVMGLYRRHQAVTLTPDTQFEVDDEILYVVATQHARFSLGELRRSGTRVRRIMIAGGGNLGRNLAQQLDADGFLVKVIEHDLARCEALALALSDRVLVLHGDATDETLLEDEGIDETDVFVALTNDDENNIMAGLLAKRMGAKRVMSLISRRSYGEIMEGSRIDIAIAPDLVTLGELLRHVRRGDVVAVHRLRWGAVEALEAVAHGDAKASRVVGRKISQLHLPQGAAIGAVVRGEDILMPQLDPVIEDGDHVIVLVTRRRLIPKIERLFQVGAAFL